MVRDRPPEGDQPGDHWYGEHVQREAAMEKQRHEYAPAATPERWRAKYYERRGVGPADRPAPFSPDKARTVPDYQAGDHARGRLDVRGGPDVGLVSGSGGGELMRRFKEVHGGRLPREQGFAPLNYHHVEAQAAAYLRMSGRREASLYINKKPCARGPDACEVVLPWMLPPTGKLTVYGPGGFVKVYRGIDDEQRGR